MAAEDSNLLQHSMHHCDGSLTLISCSWRFYPIRVLALHTRQLRQLDWYENLLAGLLVCQCVDTAFVCTHMLQITWCNDVCSMVIYSEKNNKDVSIKLSGMKGKILGTLDCAYTSYRKRTCTHK